MQTYARVIDGTVYQHIESATPPGAPWVACPAWVGPGCTSSDNITFSPPPAPAVYVPASITMRQARLALLAAGLLGNIDTAIASLPSPQKERAQIEWQYSNDVLRHNGFVASLAPALGLTDAQIDALFLSGAAL